MWYQTNGAMGIGYIGGDHTKVGEGHVGVVDVGGPAVYGK